MSQWNRTANPPPDDARPTRHVVTMIPRQHGGAAVGLMQRSWEFWFRYRCFHNAHCNNANQTSLHRPQQRYFHATRPINKTRHSKNMMDRLYDEQILKTNHKGEIPLPFHYYFGQTVTAKPPAKWMRDRWKDQFCKNDVIQASPPTQIVNEYHYNDINNGDIDADNEMSETTRPSNGLTVVDENRDVHAKRDDEYINVTRQVHRSSGETYSKTSSDRRYTGSNGEIMTSVTTISSSNFDIDSEDDQDYPSFFSNSDNDDSFFSDSDDDEVDEDQYENIIDMPTTTPLTTNRRTKALPPSRDGTIHFQSSDFSSMEDFSTPKASTEMSSSRWTISLNDMDFEHAGNTLSKQQKFAVDPIANTSYDPREREKCSESDHETQTMKPVLVIPPKRAATIDIESEKANDSWDDVLDTFRSTGGERPLKHEKSDVAAPEHNAKPTLITSAKSEYEYSDDMVNINNYSQASEERLQPKILENWWDRDNDLVRKAKSKTALATIRKAQDEPLNKRCKTCPVCKRVFRSHVAMLDHATTKRICMKSIDGSLIDQMKKQGIDMKTKKK